MKCFYKTILLLAFSLILTACASKEEIPPPDHSALINNRPNSILVLPPLNSSVEESAEAAILASSVAPLAELGYYIIPITNMMETFTQNGLFTAADIHSLPVKKLQEIFGADAALYMEVDKYGTRYVVLDSVIEISMAAKLIDLRSGDMLWENRVDIAQSARGNNNQGGIIGMLITALFHQITNTVRDSTYPVSKQATGVLFAFGNNALIPGHRLEEKEKTE